MKESAMKINSGIKNATVQWKCKKLKKSTHYTSIYKCWQKQTESTMFLTVYKRRSKESKEVHGFPYFLWGADMDLLPKYFMFSLSFGVQPSLEELQLLQTWQSHAHTHTHSEDPLHRRSEVHLRALL